ncbi:protein diaphanous homolog 1-like isoform X1 [Cydia strobilella]|uniref:protein diaphanous homolog 1-like isoform X1 n=1 Tax=Cydia strobilella TaxID=1100964 RepID=UPI003004CB56
MEVNRLHARRICKLLIHLSLFLMFIQTSHGINLGLIAGDLKRSGPGPLVVRKVSHRSPVIINVNPGLPKLPGIETLPNPVPKSLKLPCLASLPPRPFPKLPAKPPPKLLKTSKLKRSPLIPSLPRLRPVFPPPLLLPHLIPPVIPRLPLLPIIPPIMPVPTLLPFLPPPLLRAPRLPTFPPFHPLKLPILGKSPLEKTLGTVQLPLTDKAIRRKISKDLLDLKIKGSLTTPEYYRFKKLLLI